MIRRLPIYLILDCSESMAGPAFAAVQRGLDLLLTELRGNPQALETVWISVLTFGRCAKVILPLTDIVQFQMPKLILGSGTALGAALGLLEQKIKSEITTQTAERKGDWKPVCFLLSDGEPTDVWEKAADHFRLEVVGKKANLIALACGPDVNIATLKRITETVLQLQDGSEASFCAFFKWVSSSVQTTSVKYSTGRPEGLELPGLPAAVEMAHPGSDPQAERFIFLQAKCHQTRRFYLVRYRNDARKASLFGGRTPRFKFVTSHPLDNFDLETGGRGQQLSVANDQLDSAAPCPYCESRSWGMCGCGRVLCMNPGAGNYTCPWCSVTDNYAPAHFDVGRGAG